MKIKIQVLVRSVYGNELVYPLCEQGKEFAKMVGRKTLTARDLASIRKLGFEVEVVR